MWSGATRLVAFWGPLIGVGAWGAIYLKSCTYTLLAPGAGFTFNYSTPGGDIRIDCKNYSFDPVMKTLTASNLELRQPNGRLIAKIPNLVVTGLAIDDGIAPVVTMHGASAWIRRDKSGKLDVQQFIESSDQPPSQVPFQVAIKNGKVYFIDEAAIGVPQNLIQVPEASVIGKAGNLEGTIKLIAPGLLQSNVNLKITSTATEIKSDKVTVNITGIRKRVQLGPERDWLEQIKQLQFAKADATGTLWIRIPNKGSTQFRSNLTVDATQPAWGKYRGDALSAKLLVSQKGFSGDVLLSRRGTKAKSSLVGVFEPKLKITGDVSGEQVSATLLKEIGVPLPAEVQFQTVSSSGFFSFENGKASYTGDTQIQGLSAYGIRPQGLKGSIQYLNDRVLVNLPSLTVGRSKGSALGSYDLTTQAWTAYADITQADSRDFARFVPAQILGTTGQFKVVANGKGGKMDAQVTGKLDPSIRLNGRKYDFQNADFTVAFDGRKVQVNRLELNDTKGSLYVKGVVDLKSGYNLDITATQIGLSQLVADARGKGDVNGKLTGSLTKPLFNGQVEGHDLGYSGLSGNISAMAAEVSASANQVDFKNIIATRGAGQIGGTFGINLKNSQLRGSLNMAGLNITDIYEGPISGVLDLNAVTISGTLSDPLVNGEFSAKSLLAANVRVDEAKGQLGFDGKSFTVQGGSATVAGGAVSDLVAIYNLNSKSGSVSGQFKGLKLSEVAKTAVTAMNDPASGANPETTQNLLGNDVKVLGTASGKFEAFIARNTLDTLKSSGRVDDIKLNEALLGSGDWSVNFDGDQWMGDALVGSLEEYFRFDQIGVNRETGRLSGEILTYNLPIQEFFLAAEPQIKASSDVREKLRLIDGKVGLLATLTGSLSQPVISLPEFEISNLTLGKEDLGTVSMRGLYVDGDISIQEGKLTGAKSSLYLLPYAGQVKLPDQFALPNGYALFNGSVKGGKNLDFTLTAFGFPVSKFSGVAPGLEGVDVVLNTASVKVAGTTESPSLTASTVATIGMPKSDQKSLGALLKNGLRVSSEISASLTPVVPEQVRRVDLKSNSRYSAGPIEGNIVANLLMGTDGIIPRTTPIDVQLNVDGERDVTSLLTLVPGLVSGEKGARLSGGLKFSQTLDSPKIEGGFNLLVDSLKYTGTPPIIGRPLDTSLNDINVKIGVDKDAKAGYVARLDAKASTAVPGQVSLGFARLDVGLPIQDLINANGGEAGTSFMDREFFKSTLELNNLSAYQSFPQNTYAGLTAYTTNPIAITGTPKNPVISGELFLKGVETVMPSLTPQSGGDGRVLVDPRFDLKFTLAEPAKLKSSALDIAVNGSGSMTGRFSELKATARFLVDDGNLLLPGGRVKLSEDGTIDLDYKAGPVESTTRLIANMKGTTAITALKNGVTPERYDVTIEMKGDLAQQDGLKLTATSQPGDLSQDRILQLLGRTDLLTNVLQSGVNASIEEELRNAFTSFALPSLLGGFTNNLAKNLGFEYVSVDYNAYEQASISFAKSLGTGFFLQGRRQISTPLPGQPTAYDIRIAYRPRNGPNAIRNLSFSLGTDQLRPYKLSLDYTSRVRTTNAPYRTVFINVPGK